MSQQAADTVQVYADYVCPFCYLGYASLDQYRETRAEPLAVDWHPFDLRAQQRRPDGTIDESVDTGKDDEYFEKARENVEQLAAQYEVEMDEPLKTDVDSYDAQRVAWQVRDSHPDNFAAFHRGVFEALWAEGRDIGDQAVLTAIARDVGLPETVVEEALADPETTAALEAAFEDVQHRGITGVPTFVAGEHGARGAVPPEHLRRLVEGA